MDCLRCPRVEVDLGRSEPTPHGRKIRADEPLEEPDRHRQARRSLAHNLTVDRPVAVKVMSGEFTDQGVLGDAYVGKSIRQKTVIKIASANNHVFELYFTPPGEKERLVSTATYTRRP